MSDQDEFIIIKGARASFPALYKRPVINGQEGKYGCTLMLDPTVNAEAIARIEGEILRLSKERFKGRALPPERLCLRNGADKGRPEYDGYQVLSVNNQDRPYVVASDGRSRVTDPDACTIYSGCYVTAKVRLWAQDNQYGKRINGTLVAIQFAKHGEPLNGNYVSDDQAVAGFDQIEDDDDFLQAA